MANASLCNVPRLGEEAATSGTGPTTATPSPVSTLGALTQQRILDLSRVFGVRLRSTSATKKQLAQLLGAQLDGRLPAILREFGREELVAACKAHGLPAETPARRGLIETLLAAASIDLDQSVPPAPVRHHNGLPRAGQIVRARHRQWLVEAVHEGGPDESARVALVCLDDDDPGRRLDVLWDLELGAQTIEPEKRGLGQVDRLDPPEHFGAYLHALRWNAVSAADATRFQAPFRAGIEHMAHQLTPLMKALELPRASRTTSASERPSRRDS